MYRAEHLAAYHEAVVPALAGIRDVRVHGIKGPVGAEPFDDGSLVGVDDHVLAGIGRRGFLVIHVIAAVIHRLHAVAAHLDYTVGFRVDGVPAQEDVGRSLIGDIIPGTGGDRAGTDGEQRVRLLHRHVLGQAFLLGHDAYHPVGGPAAGRTQQAQIIHHARFELGQGIVLVCLEQLPQLQPESGAYLRYQAVFGTAPVVLPVDHRVAADVHDRGELALRHLEARAPFPDDAPEKDLFFGDRRAVRIISGHECISLPYLDTAAYAAEYIIAHIYSTCQGVYAKFITK